eukprot:300923-Pelagomonas_calceolata.AAC.3
MSAKTLSTLHDRCTHDARDSHDKPTHTTHTRMKEKKKKRKEGRKEGRKKERKKYATMRASRKRRMVTSRYNSNQRPPQHETRGFRSGKFKPLGNLGEIKGFASGAGQIWLGKNRCFRVPGLGMTRKLFKALWRAKRREAGVSQAPRREPVPTPSPQPDVQPPLSQQPTFPQRPGLLSGWSSIPTLTSGACYRLCWMQTTAGSRKEVRGALRGSHNLLPIWPEGAGPNPVPLRLAVSTFVLVLDMLQPVVILCHHLQSDSILPHEVDIHVRRTVQQLEQIFVTSEDLNSEMRRLANFIIQKERFESSSFLKDFHIFIPSFYRNVRAESLEQ